MTTICLIRHGQTDWNKEFKIQGRINIPLNETGKSQALNTAKQLSNIDITWDVFFSSPLDRAVETCEIIKKDLNYSNETIIMEDLIEREFGIADGMHITPEVYEEILIDNFDGMEKTKDIQHRASSAIKKISNQYENKNILITTHSHFIKALFTQLDPNLSFKSLLDNGSLNFIYIENSEIINFEFNKKDKTI